MLTCLKCQNPVRKGAKFCHECGEERKRVGVFVDYENFTKIEWLLYSRISAKRQGEILSDYAEQYGHVVCRWICAHPRNIPDWSFVKLDLAQVGFSIRKPSGVKTRGFDHPLPQQTDHALIRLIHQENLRSQLDTYVIVAGDVDYYEHIEELINRGHSVHLWASQSDGHLARKYSRLEERYRPNWFAEAGNFTIDDLDPIFRSQGVRVFGRRRVAS